MRDFFKKTGNISGTFNARMGTIKDRNGMDLTEAEDIKKKWQEYTEELYKKDLHDPNNHDGVITDLEPDILECEVKWALESITTNKASGGDGIPEAIVKINKTKSWFFEKINKIDKPLARLIKKKRRIKSTKLEMKKGGMHYIKHGLHGSTRF